MKFFLTFVFGVVFPYVSSQQNKDFIRKYQQVPYPRKADFNKTYSEKVNSSVEYIYEYSYKEYINKTTAVRITTELNTETQKGYPIIIVVREQERILSWTLPIVLDFSHESGTPYEKVSRTLCPLDLNHRLKPQQDQTIYVDVSTFGAQATNFSLKAFIMKDFQIGTGSEKDIYITPSEPEYYMYTFPHDVESVIVQAHSEDETCAVMSIQDIKCPVFDMNRDVKFDGMYQTMTRQAAITVEKSSFNQGSFYIVFVLKPTNSECSSLELIQSERSKSLTLKIKQTISSKKYYIGMVFAVGVFGGFYLIAFIIGVVYHGCTKNRGVWILSEAQENSIQSETPTDDESSPVRALNPGQRNQHSYGAIPTTQNNEGLFDAMNPVVESSGTSSNQQNQDRQSVSSLDSNEIDFLRDADHEKDVFRTKTALFVYDLSRKKYTKQSKNYAIYWRNLVAIAIFYGLPVFQLVFTYQKVLNVTGDLDICYYNFNCAHPWGLVSSFNNIFSNIGYVLLGILFLVLVSRRNIIYNKAMEQDRAVRKELGIPQHFGLFYAMGIALVMEGVMSACYHVCPNYSNFQFDTSFMYVIACLCMLKIYQTRHPDVSAKAHTSYLLMAFVIFIAVIGVVYGNSIFWIIFALVDMLFYLILSAHIYYMGRWKIDRGIWRRLFMMLRYEIIYCRKPMYTDRMVLLLIGNIINWTIAIYGAVTKPSDFASYLLGIFIGNLLIYCTFYIIMKLRYGERIHPLAVCCILTAAVIWSLALYFFFFHLTSWQYTPAVSREGNQDCMLLEFYDAHDVWHFLSAIALFTSFLVLFTLDDDQFSTRRDRIHVF